MKNEYEIGILGEQPFLETEEEGELRRRGRTSRPTAWRRPGIVPRRPRPRPRPRPGGGVGFPMPFPGFPGMDQPTGSGQGGTSTPTPSQAQGEEKVRWVQNSLNSILNSRLPVDGVMGVESRIAVREFQKKQGLPVTGFVGPDTEQALVAATRSTAGATAEPATSSSGDGDGNGQGQATDDAELLTELGISPELGLESEFGNILELELDRDRETGGDARIIDLTAKANKSLRKKMRDPKTVDTLVLHQMACCFKVKDPLTRFLKNMAPHFAILADGRILQLHPTQALTWASNGFNTNSVAVEFAGNFPSTKGKWWLDRKYLQTLTKAQAEAYIKANQNRVTPEQIEAGRYLIKHLIRTMGLKKVVSHRQSSNTRENDPGPDIWYHVGQWAIENLGVSDGGSGYKVGTGAAIPDIWRNWGRKATQQPELLAEFMETETGVDVAALGVAVFQVIQSIVSSGDLSVQSDVARYVHQNTPAHIAFTRRSIEFKISAHHPRYGIDRQNFYFRLSFEYNKYDLRNVTISVLRDKSSSLYSSSFDINFKATDYSQPTDPVTSIAYNIVNGRWDPVGLGDVSFSATPLLVIKADGSITPQAINSEKDWVRFDGWTAGTLQDTPLAAPSTPGITPQPPTPGAPGLLRMGSRGPAVSEMQIRLNRWLVSQGRAPLEVDGAFGPKTRAAVIAFQGALKLVQDGVVGPQTQAALRNY